MVQDLEDISPDERDGYLAFRAQVAGTNINEQTLLATDYLNHFNEIVMLLEMLPDMPEMLEEVQLWEPRSYPDHFRQSSFSDRELAAAAYDHVPSHYKRAFEDVIEQINRVLLDTIDAAGRELSCNGEEARLRQLLQDASIIVQKLMDHASAVIHGSVKVLDQSDIDGVLAK